MDTPMSCCVHRLRTNSSAVNTVDLSPKPPKLSQSRGSAESELVYLSREQAATNAWND